MLRMPKDSALCVLGYGVSLEDYLSSDIVAWEVEDLDLAAGLGGCECLLWNGGKSGGCGHRLGSVLSSIGL